jgi:hypothetical protein
MYFTQNNYPVVSNGYPTGWVESNQLKFASQKRLIIHLEAVKEFE